MVQKPLITVIIIAYKRKEFILEAIKSALHQNIDKQNYEIIVVKNFTDDKIDSFISSYNIKNITSKDKTLLGKILEGALISSGYFISMLEDDDVFKFNKLYEIKREYESNPKIIYIHNNYELINQNNEIIPRKNVNFDTRCVTNPDIIKSKKINFCLNYGYHNNSCITIKRSILLNNYTFLSNFTSNNWVDLSLLFLSLSYIKSSRENYCLLITNQILTEYRIHQSLSAFIPEDHKHFVIKGTQIDDVEMILIRKLSDYVSTPVNYYILSFLNIENLLFSILDPLYHGLSKLEKTKLIIRILFRKYKVISKRSIRIIIISILSLFIGERLIRVILIKLLKNGKYI